MFSELSDSLPDTDGITSQYMPDNSIALRLAGDNAFAFGSADIRPEQTAALEKVTAVLQRYPESHIEIIGYTDNIGSDKYNKLLSAKRAQSVADVLVKQGVPASSIQTLGAGKADPVAANDTPEGRSQNRRVEIHIVAE